MRDSVLRELAALALSGGSEGEAVRKYALERLPKRYLKRFKLYLGEEISAASVSIKAAYEPDEHTKRAVEDIFRGKSVSFSTDASLGAGMELVHGDNVVRFSIKSMIERAINGIKESL